MIIWILLFFSQIQVLHVPMVNEIERGVRFRQGVRFRHFSPNYYNNNNGVRDLLIRHKKLKSSMGLTEMWLLGLLCFHTEYRPV